MKKKNRKVLGIGLLSGTKVVVVDENLKSFLREKGYGEEHDSKQILSLIEALYLMEKNKLIVSDGKKTFNFEDLLKKGNEIEDNFYAKYLVYKDLRERGLLVRTGFKFGSDFRVYPRGVRIGSGHSSHLVHVIPEEYKCSFPELARAVRLAQHVNKEMIFAIVDEEGDVIYYKISKLKNFE